MVTRLQGTPVIVLALLSIRIQSCFEEGRGERGERREERGGGEEAACEIELTPFEAAKEAAPIGMKMMPTTKNVLIT